MKNLSLRLYVFVSSHRLLFALTLFLLAGIGLAQVTLQGDATVVAGDDLNAVLDQLVQEVVRQLQGGASLVSILTSAPILATIIGVLAGFANYYLTQTVKSYTRLKGWGTKLLAMFFSVVLGGILGYLGLLESGAAAGADGAWAGLSLLIAWTIGEVKHETKEQKCTGLRKVDRDTLRKEKGEQLDSVIETLIVAGAAVGIPALAIRTAYEMFGRDAVLNLIAQT